MFAYSAAHMDPVALKKILIGTVIPRPIALITSRSKEGVLNVAPFSYFNLASYEPPVFMVSFIRHADGRLKDTPQNLLDTKEGVLHIVNEALVEEANLTAKPLEATSSEFALTHWTPLESMQVNVPRIKEAPVAFEVELSDTLAVKDGNHIASDVYLLRLKYIHLSQDIYNEASGYIHYRSLQPMSRLAGDDYAQLGKIQSIKRPK